MNIISLFDVKNKNIIVTGATRGIGRSIVDDLVISGSHVTVLAKNKQSLNELKKVHSDVDTCQVDLSDKNAIEEFLKYYISKKTYCDILINNAGINESGQVDTIDAVAFQKVFMVNLFAPFLLIKGVLPHMKEHKNGVILNIASTLGTRAAPGISAYCASKSALIHFTRCLSIEVAPFNIRVNCLSPGYCKTDLNRKYFDSPNGKKWVQETIPQQRTMEASELLPLVRLLISDAGKYITGANVIIDGGVGNW